jgi:intein-encoded DNA endonuclease-like protein
MDNTININIKKYMEEVPPARKRKETVKHKKEEIITLYNEGYSYGQIADYIKKTYKLKTSRQMISNIIKEELNDDN